jgi:hypothetical protein
MKISVQEPPVRAKCCICRSAETAIHTWCKNCRGHVVCEKCWQRCVDSKGLISFREIYGDEWIECPSRDKMVAWILTGRVKA